MAARSRPRVNIVREDFADELNLWNSIVEKIRKCNTISKKFEEVKENLVLAEENLRDNDASAKLVKLDELEKLHREGVKLVEEESRILNEEPDDLIRNLETLVSVRAALEVDTPRSANAIKPRNLKRRLDADVPVDSPAATPDASTPAPASRLMSKVASRSGSVAAPSMKSENGTDGSDGKATGEKAKFSKGTEVFYKTKGKEKEGEGILCRISQIIGESKQRRYEILDVEPELDENGAELAQEPYRAPQHLLHPIPSPDISLPDLPKGKWVLALYPNTTTFYRAEMVGMRKHHCRLRFEGEDEKDKEQEVDRRYVLDIIPK